MSVTASTRPYSERAIVLIIAAVQFINIVDFMMVTPLGPFFALGLKIEESDLALLSAAYTGAAGVAGLVGSLFLDRFDRRSALAVSLFGLIAATALGGFATGLPSLMFTRVVAGLFGGPATALSMSIIADVVPPERRGRAMSTVMTSFSAATVLGVPLGLVLAEWGGWKMPFFALSALGLIVIPLSIYLLPPLRGHLQRTQSTHALGDLKTLATAPLVPMSWAMTAIVMMAAFVVIPNFPAYLNGNLGVPLENIKWLFLAGGLSSIISFRVVGKLVDKFGSFKVGTVASVALALNFYFYVVHYVAGVPVVVMFVTFMICMNFRNIAYNTLASRVPEPQVRARFQSIQSAVQHGASALAGLVSAWILEKRPEGGLLHMEAVGAIAIVITLIAPYFFFVVERGVEGRPKQPLGLTGPPSVAGPAGPPIAASTDGASRGSSG